MQKFENNQIVAEVLQKLILQSPQAFFVYHIKDQQFIYLTPAFSAIWGLTPGQEAATNSLLLTSLHPEDRDHIRSHYEQLLSGEKKEGIECRITTPDGVEKWVRISASLVEASGHTRCIAGSVEDISANKEYVDNLLKFGAKKNSVLEILSHDLAGPLHVLENLARLLATKVKPYENKEVDELISMIGESCKRNVKLIREFVANEFLESSNVVLNKQRINIIERFKQVVEEYRQSENAISKNFVFHYSHDPLFMELDDTKFMQVINNLFSNAIKFTPDNGTITLTVTDKTDTVLFTMADTGIGIPKALQPVLFDKFSKARRPGLRGEESTGLGMSIIKNLVNWHGGKIWFESEENKGTTFYIELPRE